MNPSKKVCSPKMNYDECELAILRMNVDHAETKISKRIVQSPEIQKIFKIVEEFIQKKELVCYGGIAINALLPKKDKIYNRDIELPDYDVFSSQPVEHVKELADLFYKNGYQEVEAKSGQHHGTYKLFVNFIAVLDITSLPEDLFQSIKRNAVKVDGILYCDPIFLKMSMFLELSRPSGQVDRWEKVLKRLQLIHKHYPFKGEKCSQIEFQRGFQKSDSVSSRNKEKEKKEKEKEEANKVKMESQIYKIVKDVFIEKGVVFFGGYAITQYSKYMPKNVQKRVEQMPDFDVLAKDPEAVAELVKKKLNHEGFDQVTISKKDPIGEVIPVHYEIKVGEETISFIYETIACHSYNSIQHEGKKIRIATIDTMLSFYLAFLYADRPYYDPERIYCMSKFLFDVQRKNRLEQKGLLKRFSIKCYGHQPTVEEMRSEKAKMFKELKSRKGTRLYEEWFLNYQPSASKKQKRSSNKTRKTIRKTSRKTTSIMNSFSSL